MDSQPTSQAGDAAGEPNGTWVEHVFEEMERVGARMEAALNPHTGSYEFLLSMIPNTTRRLFTELQVQGACEHCIAFLLPRFFSSSLGSEMMLKKGMMLEAATLARAALETVGQMILMMRDESVASAWLNGKRFSPGEVRKRLGGHPDLRPMYDALSAVAHPNPEAKWQSAVNLRGTGYAIFYGACYRPKNAAIVLHVLMGMLLVLLQGLYAHYRTKLSIEAWPASLLVARKVFDSWQEWIDSMPDDAEELAAYLRANLSRYTPNPMPGPVLEPTELKRVVGIAMKELGWET